MRCGQPCGGETEDDGISGLHADEDGPVVEGRAVEEAGDEGAGEEGVIAVFVCEGAEEVAAGPEGLGTFEKVHLGGCVAVGDGIAGHGCGGEVEVWVRDAFFLLRLVRREYTGCKGRRVCGVCARRVSGAGG